MIRWLRYQLSWWKWFLFDYPEMGDPLHGRGEARRRLRDQLIERWQEREPRP